MVFNGPGVITFEEKMAPFAYEGIAWIDDSESGLFGIVFTRCQFRVDFAHWVRGESAGCLYLDIKSMQLMEYDFDTKMCSKSCSVVLARKIL